MNLFFILECRIKLVFCTSCLPKFIKDNILQCPKCGHKHESPDNSTEAFSIDYTRRDLVEFFNNFCLSKEVMCGMSCITRTIDTYRNIWMSISRTEHHTWKVQRMFYFSVVNDIVGFKNSIVLMDISTFRVCTHCAPLVCQNS
jgi:hypothetical protein